MTTQFPVTDAAAEASLTSIANSQGSDATGVTQPTGGAGIRGWLSGIYKTLTSGSIQVINNFTPTVNSTGSSITAANTDQIILVANASRRFLLIQNTSASAIISICLSGVSTLSANAPNISLSAGQTLILDVTVPNTAIHAVSATAGATFSIIEG